MSQKSEPSRRAVLRGAATIAASFAVGASALNTSMSWADTGAKAIGPSLATTRPVSIEEYVNSMPGSGDESGATTGIDGVRAEYQKAASIFPLPLPSGSAFPAESTVAEPDGESGTRFSVGTGAAEAYFFWQNATAAAALSAFQRGDRLSTSRLLEAAEAGYGTAVRKMYVQDPSNSYVTSAIAAGRKGDFAPLRQQGLGEFIAHPGYRAIAARAGDRF